ncbi:SCO2525 family SAM-dependent methyltransferase [Actinoplanes sp. NPDC048967]|uniref:SCO2525 family SAM-dependent methyltransferase n=1 Tax=Actinoplanes sp. NPDC048967 TaxID=3155269 RepID=UPI003409EADC
MANSDFAWDTFDSAAYFDHNYSVLRSDDGEIIEIVADFFQSHDIPRRIRSRAIDIGAGTNLYPALTMLPFAAEIMLYERAVTNRSWLEEEVERPRPSWWEFWKHMAADRAAYGRVGNAFDLLSRRAKVEKGNIFHLTPDEYDMGTMFFVAESITTRSDEFERATQSFVNSLMPRAPFAAAFMRNSSGYRVANRDFPACSVDEADVQQALAPVAEKVRIQTVQSHGLRDGYCGMMVATGRKKA